MADPKAARDSAATSDFSLNTANVTVAAVVSRAASSIMTRGFGFTERPPAYCGDCRGKGFAPDRGKARHHRKCMRCRGVGSVKVGSTKR
jgi:hypothetical protein